MLKFCNSKENFWVLTIWYLHWRFLSLYLNQSLESTLYPPELKFNGGGALISPPPLYYLPKLSKLTSLIQYLQVLLFIQPCKNFWISAAKFVRVVWGYYGRSVGGNYGQHHTLTIHLPRSSLFGRVQTIMAKFITCMVLTVVNPRPTVITPTPPYFTMLFCYFKVGLSLSFQIVSLQLDVLFLVIPWNESEVMSVFYCNA